jgi:capsid assembly protease
MRALPSPLARPWAISLDGMQLVLAVWSRGAMFLEAREKALQARDGQPLENAHEAYVRDGVAVIPVYGPLMRRASFFNAISGATSYSDIRKDLQLALDDAAVRAVILDINSPGGEVDGCAELADAIVAARAIKPIEVYVGGMGASAAYWLASAGARITCAETALLGSIGVRLAMVDESEKDAKEGIRSVEIISSKSPGKRDKPMDDEVIARAQATVDALADVFIKKVAAQRGRKEADVLANFGQGDVMVGAGAVAAGLADRLGSLEGLIEELSATALTVSSQIAARATARAASSPSKKVNAAVRPAAPKGAAQMAKHMDPSKKTATRALRAEGAPPEPMPEGSEDEKCAHCDGSGTNPDGSKCETCDGSGSAKAESDAEPTGDGGDSEPTGDEGDDDMGAEEDEDKKEKAALARLAAKHSLPATATRAEILMAASAAPTAPSLDAKVEKLVAEKFAAAQKAKAAAEAKDRAKKLVADAIKGGYASEDKEALTMLATSGPTGLKAAERIAAPFIAKARQLYGRQVGSADTVADNRSSLMGATTKLLDAGIKKITYTSDLSAMAKALQAKTEGLSYSDALDRVMKTPEGKAAYQNYRETLS